MPGMTLVQSYCSPEGNLHGERNHELSFDIDMLADSRPAPLLQSRKWKRTFTKYEDVPSSREDFLSANVLFNGTL